MKDCFADIAIQHELKEAVESAKEYQRSLIALERMRTGATFRFPDAPLPIRWVATRQHGTQTGYWYFIVADELPLVGTHDVELSDERERGLLVARCKFGAWLHENDVDLHGFLSQLSNESVEQILSLQKMLQSRTAIEQAEEEKVPSLALIEQELRVATDEDPEYQQWTMELEQTVKQLERRVGRNLVARDELSDRSSWSTLAIVAEKSAEYRSSTIAIEVVCELPGKLFILRNGISFELRYYSSHFERPPSIQWVSDSGDSTIGNEWTPVDESEFLWLGVILLVNGEVRLRVEGKELVIPIN